MPPETLPVLLSVVIVGLCSLVGAAVLVLRGQVKRLLPALIALAAGALIGDTFLHLLPQAVEEQGGFTPMIGWCILGGLLGFFVIESVLHWHHHGEDVHEHAPGGVHSVAWMNLLGDAIHNFVDGMLIAGAWLVGPEAGVATTIAVFLHEIPQEFGDLGVLIHAGFRPSKALLLNALCGAVAILGALVVLVAAGDLGLEAALVPIAAGGFLYVACADLVPEIRKRARGWRLVVTCAALLAGLGLMALVEVVSGHDHGHGHGHGHEAPGVHDHDDHDGHDHGAAPVRRVVPTRAGGSAGRG